MRKFLLLFVLTATPLFAQTPRLTPPAYASVPAACNVGDIVTKTGSMAGLYACTAANTWTELGSGGGEVPSGWTWDADGMNGPTGVAAFGVTSTGTPGAYTLAKSGIIVRNGDGDEVFRIWGTDPDGVNDYNAQNLYIGWKAGLGQPTDNTSAGYFNTGIGASALATNTTGVSNVAVGANALAVNVDGAYNTAVGFGALPVNTSGVYNTAVGLTALSKNISGSVNTALGANALYNVTTGGYNVGIGSGALSLVTDGIQNTLIGAYDPLGDGFPAIVHGTGNSALGYNAGPTGDYSNTLALGNGALPSASNHAVIGNGSVTDVYLGSESALALIHSAGVQVVGLTAPTNKPVCFDASGNLYAGTNTAGVLSCP